MVSRNIPFKKVGILFLLTVAYFTTRLTNIMALPMFTDEAIYVRWAQIARFDAAWRFISLTDGKQPSFIWMAMNSMRIFDDPLFASRIVSVGTGFIALIGVMLLSWEIFKKKQGSGILHQMFGHLKEPSSVGFIAGLLFVLYPFALVYDRMALYDSTVAATMVWSLYATVLLVRYVRLDLGIIFGIIAGSALLTKTSGFFSLYLLPFSLLLFDWKQNKRKKKLLELIFFVFVGVSISFVMYSVLRLSPFFYIIDEKNGLFVWPLKEWFMQNQLEIFISNSKGLFGWFLTYVSIPVVLLALGSFVVKEKFKEKLFLFIWFAAPFFALLMFGKTIYPRFIYFMTPVILVLASWTLSYLLEKVRLKFFFYVMFLVVVVSYMRVDYFIINDFSHAPIPKPDLGQYINSWPAGGGVKEMIAFFEEEVRQNGKIYVATQGTFGSLPTYAMEIYLGKNTNIETEGIYPLPNIIPEKLKEKAKTMPVYVVLNDTENPPSEWPVTLIVKYQKGIGDRYLSIYQVNP